MFNRLHVGIAYEQCSLNMPFKTACSASSKSSKKFIEILAGVHWGNVFRTELSIGLKFLPMANQQQPTRIWIASTKIFLLERLSDIRWRRSPCQIQCKLCFDGQRKSKICKINWESVAFSSRESLYPEPEKPNGRVEALWNSKVLNGYFWKVLKVSKKEQVFSTRRVCKWNSTDFQIPASLLISDTRPTFWHLNIPNECADFHGGVLRVEATLLCWLQAAILYG